MTRIRRAAWVWCLLLGCATSRRAPAPSPLPPAEAPADSPATLDERERRDEDRTEKSEGYAEPPTDAAPAAEATTDFQEASPTLLTELSDLDRAEQLLSASFSDCSRACRALASMKRSADRVCEIEPPPGSGRCREARRRVAEARARVLQQCGACRRDD
jgi:hypothetical protein